VKDLMLTNSNMEFIAQELRKLDLNQPKRLVISEWKPNRSVSANNQQHLWYGQIAKAKGDVTALDIKNWCKASLGLPILLNSVKHGDKMEFLLNKLDYYKHSYESQMKLIQCLEVTSLFNTPEAKEYMDNMIFYWNDNGVPIKFKE
jgi:hypothetical protein